MGIFHIVTMILGVFLIENLLESGQMRKEILQSEKLRIVGELAASFAHEIRNPLTVVKGFLQLLKFDVDDSKASYVNLSIQELERANYIISDYLSFAKPQALRMSKLNISESVKSAMSMMSSFALISGVQIQGQIDDDIYIIGNETSFKQIILNLVKNAIEALPLGGHVEVFVEGGSTMAYITIRDDGEGISPDQLNNLGEIFFTTKETGTGLGLFVTKKVLSDLHDKVEFQSSIGIGTEVKIILPLYPLENTYTGLHTETAHNSERTLT